MTRSQLLLSVEQLGELRACLEGLSQQGDVRFTMLGDLSGQEIVSWDARNDLDTPSIAALIAGDLMATLEIGRMLGGKRTCNLIIQEHEDMTILVGRVGEGLLLLLATAKDVPLGWARLALKRSVDRILAIVGTAAMTPPPSAVSDDFEMNFAAQIESIW
ncbi:MAG: roadblock/LC7 domain-containing protein [Chloroflexaceae bacterium]|jgi:predicted regulator of Ras-like GTPase activity (Roadblock/LC7/MglB family)|nr:roadblock/LC7 domain-containing protein [Chloroflexaceae bacterium]